MPVKVRCPGCETVLNAPDKARGKVLKCPKCETKVRVPTGQRKAAAVKKKAPAAPPESDSDLLADLDLGRVEHTDEQVCPRCAAPIEPDQTVCDTCGHNLQTGRMDETYHRRQTRKTPPFGEFMGMTLQAWKWAIKSRRLIFLTTAVWTFFGVLNFACRYMFEDYCERLPPKTFWLGLTVLAGLGLTGWFLFLSLRVIGVTMEKKDKIKRLNFDAFQTVAYGLRSIFWPTLITVQVLGILFPVTYFALTMWPENPVLLYVELGVVGAFILFSIAVAMVHMNQAYTFRAWIAWELLQISLRNLAPSILFAVWGFLAIVVVGGAGLLMELYGGGFNPMKNEYLSSASDWIAGFLAGFITNQVTPDSFIFQAIKGLSTFGLGFLFMAPFYLLAAIPSVYLMRVAGLIGLHYKPKLGLINKMVPGTPAGFWVRLLAFLVDLMLFPLAGFVVMKEKNAVIVAQLLNALTIGLGVMQGVETTRFTAFPIWLIYTLWMYFAVSEASNVKTTIGKDGFGLMVTTENGKKMTLKQGTGRFFASILSVLLLGLGFLMCAFTPKKVALHDRISKSRVVYQGDKG